MEWLSAPDIQTKIKDIIRILNLAYLEPERIFCFRSFGSKSRARARIWSLPRIWQKALRTSPAYCLEVLAEKFDSLSPLEQEKILVHELLHIPRNFSGTLLAHRKFGKIKFEQKVDLLFSGITQP